jgi:hypothetical protein
MFSRRILLSNAGLGAAAIVASAGLTSLPALANGNGHNGHNGNGHNGHNGDGHGNDPQRRRRRDKHRDQKHRRRHRRRN